MMKMLDLKQKKLFDDANNILKEIIKNDYLTAKGILSFLPANSNLTDDILIYENEERKNIISTFHCLRQQNLKDNEDEPYYSLSDFIAPEGEKDYLGFFSVAIFGVDDLIHKKQYNDDYNSILIKAIADRLAEAFSEILHENVRKSYWGYNPNENLEIDQILKLKYQGIRPAFGYPSQPDHTEKITMWKLLDIEKNTGITLTDSLAMLPASSVSALLFSNSSSKYFSVGKIAEDQVIDYSKRKNFEKKITEKNLSSILGYK